MKLRDALGVSDERQRQLVRLLQVVLVGITLFGVFQLELGLAINAGLSLAVTFLPAVLKRDYRIPMDAGLVLWITFAAFLHAVGVLGPYRSVPWWDSVTHTLSSTIVAGAGYATVRAFDLHSDAVEFPDRFMFAFILVFVMAFGVLWEIMEFATGLVSAVVGGRALLAQYGMSDIIYDLVFNQVGALIVAVWGTVHLRNLAGSFARRMDESGERGQ